MIKKAKSNVEKVSELVNRIMLVLLGLVMELVMEKVNWEAAMVAASNEITKKVNKEVVKAGGSDHNNKTRGALRLLVDEKWRERTEMDGKFGCFFSHCRNKLLTRDALGRPFFHRVWRIYSQSVFPWAPSLLLLPSPPPPAPSVLHIMLQNSAM